MNTMSFDEYENFVATLSATISALRTYLIQTDDMGDRLDIDEWIFDHEAFIENEVEKKTA